jgi:hypothetical protein
MQSKRKKALVGVAGVAADLAAVERDQAPRVVAARQRRVLAAQQVTNEGA